jgi:cyd operon protein YbgT
MWYFTWILGIGVALAFGLINALWLEAAEKFENAEEIHPVEDGSDH